MSDGAPNKAAGSNGREAERSREAAPDDKRRSGEGTPASARAEVTLPAVELEALEGELAEANDKFLRLAAELDNVRKRSARDVDTARRLGIERFAQTLLPVVDSLEAALAAENASVETLLEGQRATLKLLEQALRDAGIAAIDPRGERFDPNLHEAISVLPVPGAAPESVVEVIQKGYALQERLLRPARVIVAQPPQSSE